MPYNLHIIKTSDFVKLDATGRLDLKQSRDVLAGLAKLCINRGIDCALIDVRDIRSPLSVSDLYTLAKTFNETGFHEKHRLAVLHRYNAGEKAELFAMFASSRGWHVAAFEDYEHAIEWFSSSIPLDGSSRKSNCEN
jgi:hypothetical protein